MISRTKSTAEVRAEWQKRRSRHWIAFGGFLGGQVILLLVDFLLEPTPGKPGLPEHLYRSFTIGSLLLFLVFVQWNRRCPACGKDAGGLFQSVWQIKNCKNCSAQLQD